MSGLNVLVWVVEGTWQGCVDAVLANVPAGAEVTLLHVTGTELAEVAGGASAGLLGRGRRGRDPGALIEAAARVAAEDLLDAAEARLGRPAARVSAEGRVERVVVEVAAERAADLLVLARDGDRARLGPRSLGPATRFVVDHAPCAVLLAWPDGAPGVGSIPPPPPPGHQPPPR